MQYLLLSITLFLHLSLTAAGECPQVPSWEIYPVCENPQQLLRTVKQQALAQKKLAFIKFGESRCANCLKLHRLLQDSYFSEQCPVYKNFTFQEIPVATYIKRGPYWEWIALEGQQLAKKLLLANGIQARGVPILAISNPQLKDHYIFLPLVALYDSRIEDFNRHSVCQALEFYYHKYLDGPLSE